MRKKALIIVDHGSTVKEANEMLAEVTNLVRSSVNCDFDIVRHCHMEIAEPSISQAFDECVAQGANHIVVHPYFLAPGRHSTMDIPNMVKDAAKKHKGITYAVTEPLGIHSNIVEVVLEKAGKESE
jgi:sirohydrochlorin ferrochelatase